VPDDVTPESQGPNHYRTSPRLRDYDYLGSLVAHLTFVTREREPVFQQEALARICLTAIEEATRQYPSTVFAFCVMPDHVHLLVEMMPDISLKDFTKHFKQLSGFRIKAITGVSVWQQSYHDRLLRREDSIADVANYIWENPVRAGLVEERHTYPYSGPREALEQA
jgi:putative transposase